MSIFADTMCRYVRYFLKNSFEKLYNKTTKIYPSVSYSQITGYVSVLDKDKEKTNVIRSYNEDQKYFNGHQEGKGNKQ